MKVLADVLEVGSDVVEMGFNRAVDGDNSFEVRLTAGVEFEVKDEMGCGDGSVDQLGCSTERVVEDLVEECGLSGAVASGESVG